MFKMLFGAAVVVALVGYGVVTTDDVQAVGDELRRGVNQALQAGADATSDSMEDEIRRRVTDAVKN